MTDRELLEAISKDVSEIKRKLTTMEMTIENELQPNIIRVAEGHIDLYRNLKDVKGSLEMIDGKIEMYDLNLKHLDNEVKKLKMA